MFIFDTNLISIVDRHSNAACGASIRVYFLSIIQTRQKATTLSSASGTHCGLATCLLCQHGVRSVSIEGVLVRKCQQMLTESRNLRPLLLCIFRNSRWRLTHFTLSSRRRKVKCCFYLYLLVVPMGILVLDLSTLPRNPFVLGMHCPPSHGR